MKLFPYGHATHPHWQMAADMVLAQLRACMKQDMYAPRPGLGLLYVTDHLARYAQELLDHLAEELPGIKDWCGTVGVGICANNVEYFDEPAIAVMLCDIDPEDYRVFSGAAPLGQAKARGFAAHSALVHADSHTPELSELIEELAAATGSGCVFGGLTSSRADAVQFALGSTPATPVRRGHGVYHGGLSGVAFSAGVSMQTRVTQGCTPIGEVREVTEVSNGHVVMTLAHSPALYALMQDLHVPIDNPRSSLDKVRETLVGLSQPGQPVLRLTGGFDDAVMVRHIIGLDPVRHGVAIAHHVQPGMQLAFCKRDAGSAKADLLRIATEIRESLEPQEQSAEEAALLADSPLSQPHPARRIAGAIYISCTGRGGPHFGAPHAELHIIRRALGDVPLVGFFAAGEIANRQVYGYTGVLTVFTTQ
jgi:small ligand-binding sensory domain FIST